MIINLKSLNVLFALSILFALFGAVAPATAQNKEADTFVMEQVELTEDHITGYLQIAPKLSEMFDRIDKAGGEPDKKLVGELEALAKVGGFQSFEELEIVVSNINFVMSGIDEETGTFTEPVEVLKAELKDTQADKSIQGEEKEQLVASIKESIAQTPKLKYPGNVDIVKKHMKALTALYQE